MATTIGKLIEQEVRRQGRSITAFADEICCTYNRKNEMCRVGKRNAMVLLENEM